MAMNDFSQSVRELQRQLQGRWLAMQPRERQVSGGAAALGLLALLYFVGLRPALHTLNRAPTELHDLDAQIMTMRHLAIEASGLHAKPMPAPMEVQMALKGATDRLGETAHLSIQADRATLTVNAASGEALGAWLEEVRVAARARPVQASLQQVGLGRYNGSIVVGLQPSDADH